MAKLWKKIIAVSLAAMMSIPMAVLAACKDDSVHTEHVDANNDGICDVCGENIGTVNPGPDDPDDPDIPDDPDKPVAGLSGSDPDADKYTDNSILNDGEEFTYNIYTTVSPSNWNELTYQDENDTQIMNYIMSPFFEFDYEYDENGEIVPGGFSVKYSAVRAIEDVTDDYADEMGYNDAAVSVGGYAWKFTLRSDLKWDDGTPIHAEDFVYTMQEQLNPDFFNYRADSYYNSGTMIHNARNYLFQGQGGWYAARNAFSVFDESIYDMIIFSLGNSTENEAYGKVVNTFRTGMGFPDSYTAADVATYITTYGVNSVVDATVDEILALQGKTYSQIMADEALMATWKKVLACWQTEPNEELDFFVVDYTFPEMDFSEVGLRVGANENELILLLDKNVNILDGDGSLTYLAAYQLSSLPLVKKDLYEQCKQSPVSGSTLWTSTYNSSVETSASWGPYKLTQFQPGTSYTLERNENWYGYQLEKYEGQYQTDKIYCRTIAEWNTAWQAFQIGDLDSIGITTTIADDYKNSSHALFTPSDLVASMQLQSSPDALKARETAGVDKEMLLYTDFRKALSLSLDRAEFAATTTVSSLAGFGLFNSMHYYDVAHGGVYRNTEPAMRVILDVYGGVENDDGTWTLGGQVYGDLVEAYDAVTGYDLALAKELLTSAYNEALAAGTISATDKVVLTFGSAEWTEVLQQRFDFLKASFAELAKGTPLEGRLDCELNTSFGDEWAESFRNGEYDICLGGWNGAAWDPGYFLLAYLDPSYMYSAAWDTSSEEMTFTMPTVSDWTEEENKKAGLGVELTMSLMDWYACLNGTGSNYNWSAGTVPDDVRLELIAALEKVILEHYYSVPMYNEFAAELYSYKTEFISTEYNTFMAYGGIQYMTYNYNDAEWADYIENNTLDYRN